MTRRLLLSLALLAGLACRAAEAAPVVIKLGTLAPDGSTWHLLLKDLAQKWREASGGQVELKIFAGGVAGDEPDMVRKMRIGQYQAAAVTVVGLSLITPEPQALCVPQLLTSYEELDAVRDTIVPEFERKLEEKGFVVINWGDAGWLRFFSTRPIVTPDDLKKLKMFVWAGDTAAADLWRRMGYNPVSLAATDIVPSLKTGLIEVAPMTALSALAMQAFVVARHMTAVEWAPLLGATVVSRAAWEKIPAELRPRLVELAREMGDKLRREVRKMEQDAVEAMVKKGVVVHPVDAAARAQWREMAEQNFAGVRGAVVPADAFDRIKALRDEYRGRRKAAGTAEGR